jgi:lysyl-tRNA synthetase class 2
MTDWKPSSDSSVAKRRAEMLARARHYFEEQKVLAVDTPALSRYATSDPNIESLSVRTKPGKDSFLHTSPEIYMKRLLAGGYPDIYTICRVFRDGEAGKRHRPEFTMAEWYRLGFDLGSIIEDTVRFVAACLDLPKLADDVVHYEFADAIREFAGVDVFAARLDQLIDRCTDDARLKTEIGEDRDAALNLLVSTIVAPQFARDRLTVLRHYPASQGALARLCPADERVADRFEVFCGDLELANGYVELTDAKEQRQRIDQDLERRLHSGRSSFLADESLLAALDAGLPDCAGVAVGIERLQMVLDQTDDIRDVVSFSSETS